MPSHIRVLTISAEEDGDFLSALVASLAQPSIPVTTVDLLMITQTLPLAV